MRRAEQLLWHCLNRACGETAPVTDAEDEVELRLCVCGSPMKKQAQPEVFSYLNFLRQETPGENGEHRGKEPQS